LSQFLSEDEDDRILFLPPPFPSQRIRKIARDPTLSNPVKPPNVENPRQIRRIAWRISYPEPDKLKVTVETRHADE
jgi:hypothetical protein